MNNGLLLLTIGLIALVGSICTILYSKTQALFEKIENQNSQISKLTELVNNVVDIQKSTQDSISELSSEMQLREVYQDTNDRHKLAITAAKNGKGIMELMSKHGLSSDEASLIIALHGANRNAEVSIPSRTIIDSSETV